ncbi:guanine nucleotide binding protein, alpha subunit [Histomonas meleagridis]|uniref:guanine nucleotide binding protein, alpha subunit n=1 Tax=Histomonas meleagridis TaxID=135588 RepID=UPI00355AC14B|nr:guanine nucleotide binding protein, alpha subunit [Histomonas meleagridis]KAH0801853.1 guanine nucleotide binding protein, alpha subunit [Histomonas meleagridis]
MGCGQSKVVPEQISPLPPCKTSVKDHAQQNIQPKEEEPIKNEEPKEITSNTNNEKQPILIKDNDIEAFGLILCGTGETGKTTYARQLKLKYVGIEDDERKSLIPTIKGNLVESMQLLLIWLERNSMEISPDLEQAAQDILALNPFACDFTPQLAESLQQLWQDPSIQTAYRHKDETIIPDNVGYFFDKIDDLQDEDYVPSDDDVLRVRVRSIGIDSITFDLDGAIIRIYMTLVVKRMNAANGKKS